MGNRIFYACQAVQMTPAVTGDEPETGSFTTIRGLQSVGLTTNFNLEPIYQLGQLSLYENYEEIPEVEISLNKVLDGNPLIYEYAIGEGDIIEKTNHKSALRLSLFPDTTRLAGGTPDSQVQITPVYLSSVTYTFPTEGNFTEEVSLVANNKEWGSYADVTAFTDNQQSPAFGAGDEPGTVLRRGQLDLENCSFPTDDIGSIGTDSGSGTKITNITITANLGREQLRTLGRRGPYLRYVNFPMEVTAEIEVQATEAGDRIDGVEQPNDSDECALQRNLGDRAIKIVTCDGTSIDLGSKCKLTSVSFNGGDTGGGNATITYSYQTYNDFIVSGPNT